ncbi:MAG: hypothetical protein JWP83_2680 [Mycobacterium sp.]|jgi:P27 family predicted phage terminase small subunit|nr:hypothetical protein [Mycobacterium sp.]
MPGPPPKPAAKRQRSRRRMGFDIGVVSAAGTAPPTPRGLSAQAQTAWTGYWSDVVSGVMRRSDSTLALRWSRNLDRYHRLLGVADKEPLVTGSTGQPRPNPLYDLVAKFEASIKEDEKQLGIGPLNRLRLGVALSESAKSLADLNAEAENDQDDFRAGLACSDGDDPA